MFNFKNWLLTEGMKFPQDIPQGYIVKIEMYGNYGFIKIVNPDINYQQKQLLDTPNPNNDGKNQLLFAEIVKITNHPESKLVYVPHNSAIQSWGPLGYDLAIEYATMKG